jgi:ATP-dependent Clp protease ATP-binding subunit ClpA
MGMPFQMQNNEMQPGDAIAKYGVDLTQLAAEGKLDPVIGKETQSLPLRFKMMTF